MQFIFNEDNNLYGYAHGDEEEFEFPTNIKQMGCIDDNIRIYMEDYVYTYLYQYAKTGGNKEKLAVLVGKQMLVDGQEVIVISGAIQGRKSAYENGVESFTDESWTYINHQMDVYFKGLHIVGWMHTQPGFGAFLMSRDECFHRNCFTHDWQVLYVLDPLERLDAFYVHNSEKTGLRQAKGYFVYYEKNEEMQEYMLENSVVKPKATIEEQMDMNLKLGMPENENIDEKQAEKSKKLRKEESRIDAAAKIRRVLRAKNEISRKEEKRYRYTFLAGISGILCIACFMLSISLIHSMDRLQKLESEVVSVKSAYTGLEQMIESNMVTSVYASQTETEQLGSAQVSAVPTQSEASSSVPAADAASEAPAAEPAPAAPEEQQVQQSTQASDIPAFYIVEEGDNLGYISLRFYGNKSMMDKIMEANGITDPDRIFFGDKLILPQS